MPRDEAGLTGGAGATPDPLLITVAPNGARRGKRDHPAIPLTPAELADDARACAEAGAAMYHLHVRDAEGGHSLDPDSYRAAIDAIVAAVGDRLLIQVTTEACGVYGRAAQMAAVRALRPAAASFALREFLAEDDDPGPALDFFAEVAETGVLPQFILYDRGEARRLRGLIAERALPFARPACLFVLGRYGDGPPSTPAALLPFLAAWDDAGPWSVCAFGPREIAVAAAAAALGGHVRVGFENNLQRPDGSLLPSNAAQVVAVASVARIIGRPLAEAADAGGMGAARHAPERDLLPCI